MPQLKHYILTNQFAKPYYNIMGIIDAYQLPIVVVHENTVIVSMTESEVLDLQESYPGLGIFEQNTEYNYF